MAESNGIGFNINALSGRPESDVNAYKNSLNKTIASVSLVEDGNGELHINFIDGTTLVLFDDDRSCCESRYMTTDDVLADFAGATFNGVEIAEGPDVEGVYETHEQQFLKVSTSKGVFTMVTHNQHNGYYGGMYIRARVSTAKEL